MIVGSLLLILVAVALLVLGLANGSSMWLMSSIATSLLAAVALVAGARQAVAARTGTGRETADPQRWDGGPSPEHVSPSAPSDPVGGPVGPESGRREGDGADWPLPTRSEQDDPADDDRDPPGGPPGGPDAVLEAEDPAGDPDEPPAQQVPPADAARVARMQVDVLVVDGRPRYHLPECSHLVGRETEPLPVGEAVELGFTPCAICAPADALLLGAGRG